LIIDYLRQEICRNVSGAIDEVLKGKRYSIHHRDPLFTAEF